MLQHSTGVDHVVILVRDLDAARDRYARLGFTLSPRGFHSPHMGTANHTLMLQDDYFELLGVVQPTEHNLRWREAVARREGLRPIALKTDSAMALAEELRGRGLDMEAPVEFTRPVDLPGGSRAEASFAVTRLPAEATPGADMFACEHRSRDTVWVPELLRHANTAQGLAGITVAVDEPGAVAAAYRRIFGDEAVETTASETRVATGSIPLVFTTPAEVKARHGAALAGRVETPAPAGFAIRVADLGAAERCLKAAGVRYAGDGRRLCVHADDACGVALELRVG
jgi:catechol 2,3-dioxygenase-like lactoylglutathione lyase family enzyme